MSTGKELANHFEEAFFIKYDGSPLKRDIPLTNDNDSVPPLVQLDLRFDMLRTFLEHIQRAVNHHDEVINGIQTDVNTRATESCLADYFERIADGLHKDCGQQALPV